MNISKYSQLGIFLLKLSWGDIMAKLNCTESNFKSQICKEQKDIRKKHGEKFYIYIEGRKLVRAEYD
ncbi:hypothetical protein J43TS9_13470 [Paenibacillus cineris]|nr:hypothetical protein J43TS9_13470 [Paenibacillus cineris]